MPSSYSDFNGALLRRVRIALDVPVAELASAAGCHVRQIARFESGREMPEPEVIRALAAYLRISTYCFTDPDVTVTRDEVIVRRRPRESEEDYAARFLAASPPLSGKAKTAIRAAADDFWMGVRRKRRERRKGERRKISLWVAVERRIGERRKR